MQDLGHTGSIKNYASFVDFFYFQPNEPGLYGRISEMRSWIDTNMPSAQFCPNGGADAASSKCVRRKNKNKKKNKKESKQKRKNRKEN